MELIFGKLTLQALPHEWFTIGGSIFVTAMLGSVALYITKLKRWKWMWHEWITTTDPKKIGIMYIIVAFLMFARGGLDAIMIWIQQAMVPSGLGYLSADHFQQIFTAHGNIMVLFVTMGFLSGLLNLIIPLQIGARDVASPLLNTLSFWLYVAGAILINMFFVVGGEFSATGWLAIAPLSSITYSPGVGVDYWIWSLQVSGLGTLLAGINFVLTILTMRAPGMSLRKMPMFVWGSLASMLLALSVFPLLSATTLLLFLDRYFGMHFFTTTNGGNPMMYVNLIWSWGHPEVYILILPAFAIFSEVVATFSGKKLAGYMSAVMSLSLVMIISMLVWLHHFFTMGAGADVNSAFGIATEFIAIPVGAQIFNWIMTMYKGKIRFTTPMYWFFGFIATFTFGGLAGVMLAVPGIDFQVHNSLFLVAHFHTMIVGGALFGIFAGITYWFPKATGFTLNETLGKYAFWCWLVGFFVSFVPLYILGMMGATRRLDTYPAETGWQPLFIVAAIGGCIISLGVLLQVVQVIVSVRDRKKHRDTTGDPWNGRTLEWATPSPAPFYNFAVIPQVTTRDAFWEMKKNKSQAKPVYEDFHMPKNTAAGLYIAVFIFLVGFAFVWHITWLIIVGIVGAIVVFLKRAFDDETEYVLTAKEVARLEEERIHHA